MRKLLSALCAVVLMVFSVFSAYSAITTVSCDAEGVQSTKVIKASINIDSDTPILSGQFALCYDNSIVSFRSISSPDFYIETSEGDGVINIVIASKDGVGVSSGELKLEFDRLTFGELVLSFDSAECVDISKQYCSVSSSGVTITLPKNVVENDAATQDLAVLEKASADSFVVKGEPQSSTKIVLLSIAAALLFIMIAAVKIKEEKELRR